MQSEYCQRRARPSVGLRDDLLDRVDARVEGLEQRVQRIRVGRFEAQRQEIDAAELVLRQRLKIELGDVAIDDRGNVRRLVEESPFGFDQRQVCLLTLV